MHPQKQLFKGQVEQEPFHAHWIQKVFFAFLQAKPAQIYLICVRTDTGSRRSGVRACRDANSCTTIAKAGKRRGRGGGSREEDAARPEGSSRHHGPDAEMPGQERPGVPSIPTDFPGGSPRTGSPH